jgi:hypothetical protein
MRLAYDPATDSLYIHLSERPAADFDEVTDGVVLDYDAEGTLVERAFCTPCTLRSCARALVRSCARAHSSHSFPSSAWERGREAPLRVRSGSRASRPGSQAELGNQ